VWAEDLPPGQVDFGAFTAPTGGGEFVEVNLPPGLIALGASLVEKEEPEVAKLLNGLKRVRVNVIGLDEANRAEMQKRVQKVRNELSGKGWERIVVAQEKGQDVGIYLKMGDKGAVQGLVALVMDSKEHAVFVNVVGEIKPEQVTMLGDKLHLDPLKKIGRATEKPQEKTKAPEKAED
jgi:Na+-translocating ferredoxin:NAD+ oxidoreductase RnfG subunit